MKIKSNKRERLTPEQLDANYRKFMKGKEDNPEGKDLFEKTIAKAATPVKQRGSK